MQKQLSLVELATYGYTPDRVKKGSWLEQTFGTKHQGVEKNGSFGRPDPNQSQNTGR